MNSKANEGCAVEANLGYAIKQAHHLMRAAIEQRTRAAGLDMSLPHLAALFLLSETPGLSGAQLARWAMVTPQTMNQILKFSDVELYYDHVYALKGVSLRSTKARR